MNKKAQMALRLQSIIFTILFLSIIGLLAWLGKTYHKSYDLTLNQQNSLHESTQKLLKKLKQPLKLIAYVPDDATVHTGLKKLISKYQKIKTDTQLEFINPDLDPQRAKADGIQFSGQLLIKLGNKRIINHVGINVKIIPVFRIIKFVFCFWYSSLFIILNKRIMEIRTGE